MRTILTIVTHAKLSGDAQICERLPATLRSLRASGYPGPVTIVDDGSTHPLQLENLAKLEAENVFQVVRRPQNGGTSRAKNTCIRVIRDSKADIGFLAEDDTLFKRPGWWTLYEEAHQKTGFQHFSFALPDYTIPGFAADPGSKPRVTPQTVNGCGVVRLERLNGIFLTFTPQLIQTLGGFRIYPTPWGGGHSHYTNRAVMSRLIPYFVDVAGSGEYIGLNEYADFSVTSEEDKARYVKILKDCKREQNIFFEIEE